MSNPKIYEQSNLNGIIIKSSKLIQRDYQSNCANTPHLHKIPLETFHQYG